MISPRESRRNDQPGAIRTAVLLYFVGKYGFQQALLDTWGDLCKAIIPEPKKHL